MHAIDVLFPGAAHHGELAGAGALYSAFLRGDETLAGLLDACLRRHELPRVPGDIGLSPEQFTEALLLAPSTRPDRYTILEHLDLDEAATRSRVDEFVATYGH
jgi:glycerol-1-phosphate dehydrogenase [NAD(P)+]